MSAKTPPAVQRTDADWPTFAPAWADTSRIDGDGVTFERSWTVPAIYRDAAPLIVVRLQETFVLGTDNPPWSLGMFLDAGVGGYPAMWSDARVAQVAETLDDIVKALRGVSG